MNVKLVKDVLQKYQGRMRGLQQLIDLALEESRERREAIKEDIDMKDEAFMIDQRAHTLHDQAAEVDKVTQFYQTDKMFLFLDC